MDAVSWEAVAVCDTCWAQRSSEVPKRLTWKYRGWEPCYFCHADTRSGIYLRAEIPNPVDGTSEFDA